MLLNKKFKLFSNVFLNREEKKIDFWLEIENYKKLSTYVTLKNSAEEIFNTYLQNNSGITLEASLLKDLQTQMKSANPNIFNKIQSVIFQELEFVFFFKKKILFLI